MHWMADAKRADRAPRSNVPEQQREGPRHGRQKRRAQREGAEGSEERAGGGAHRENVQDDPLSGAARDPAGSFSGDEDTRQRKRRETVTETREKRYLKKRIREGGSKGRALAMALDAADD